jgi:hypothetical protein
MAFSSDYSSILVGTYTRQLYWTWDDSNPLDPYWTEPSTDYWGILSVD